MVIVTKVEFQAKVIATLPRHANKVPTSKSSCIVRKTKSLYTKNFNQLVHVLDCKEQIWGFSITIL